MSAIRALKGWTLKWSAILIKNVITMLYWYHIAWKQDTLMTIITLSTEFLTQSSKQNYHLYSYWSTPTIFKNNYWVKILLVHGLKCTWKSLRVKFTGSVQLMSYLSSQKLHLANLIKKGKEKMLMPAKQK